MSNRDDKRFERWRLLFMRRLRTRAEKRNRSHKRQVECLARRSWPIMSMASVRQRMKGNPSVHAPEGEDWF